MLGYLGCPQGGLLLLWTMLGYLRCPQGGLLLLWTILGYLWMSSGWTTAAVDNAGISGDIFRVDHCCYGQCWDIWGCPQGGPLLLWTILGFLWMSSWWTTAAVDNAGISGDIFRVDHCCCGQCWDIWGCPHGGPLLLWTMLGYLGISSGLTTTAVDNTGISGDVLRVDHCCCGQCWDIWGCPQGGLLLLWTILGYLWMSSGWTTAAVDNAGISGDIFRVDHCCYGQCWDIWGCPQGGPLLLWTILGFLWMSSWWTTAAVDNAGISGDIFRVDHCCYGQCWDIWGCPQGGPLLLWTMLGYLGMSSWWTTAAVDNTGISDVLRVDHCCCGQCWDIWGYLQGGPLLLWTMLGYMGMSSGWTTAAVDNAGISGDVLMMDHCCCGQYWDI